MRTTLATLALVCSGCWSTGAVQPGDLSRELTLLVADVQDAVDVIDDPELQDDLADLVDDLEALAQLVASAETTAAAPLAQQLLDLSTALMAVEGLPTEAKLALVGVRSVLRRVIAAG